MYSYRVFAIDFKSHQLEVSVARRARQLDADRPLLKHNPITRSVEVI
jgi:hypothetical protein